MKNRRPSYTKGSIYHLFNRGANRSKIFFEEKNYDYVIMKLHKYSYDLDITPIAYCFMPNHYHLLVRQEEDQPAGLLPQRIFNGYTKAINKQDGRTGTLFQGAYCVKEVKTESHLLHLCRYIHANPVKDGLCQSPAEWLYSDYVDWIGVRKVKYKNRIIIDSYFQDADAYRDYVNEYLLFRRRVEEVDDYLQIWEG